MKPVLNIITLATIALAACNSGNNASSASDSTRTKPDAMTAHTATPPVGTAAKNAASVKDMVDGYLQIKNGLAADNGSDAASGGNALVGAINKMDTTSLSPEQKKAYADLADDTRENAEHIGKNAGKIAHQREHFDVLSKDMYQLVKTFGASQPLFLDSCPMYDNGKGATWLSEIKEIKNPYLGQKMPACGSVEQEIK